MKKILLSMCLTLFCCLTCSAHAAAKAEKLQTDKLSIILDWYPNPDHAPLIIAKQRGFFKEENLEVKFIDPSDPTDPPKLVSAGKADIGITYEPEYINQVDRGLPLIRIGTLIDKPLDCVVTLQTSGIHNMKELRGKRIGSGSGVNAVMLKSMLRYHGLTDKDVEIINVRYNLTQALLSHKVDAVSGMMRNFEIPLIESRHQKVTTFLPEENGIPNYSVLIFVAHMNNVQDPRFPRFLRALKKAVDWLDSHPQEGWNGFAQAYPEANNPVNREAWFATIPYFAEYPAEFNKIEWHKFAAYMYENKMINKLQPASRYAVELNIGSPVANVPAASRG
jgi:putative hydroxymethylpyrimidine transport system substrate-binding protein